MSDTTNNSVTPNPSEDLGNPQSLVDAALSPAPVAPVVTEPLPPIVPPAFVAPTQPEPPITPAPATPTVSMGDDTPLAFVVATPNPTATTHPTEPSPVVPAPTIDQPQKKSSVKKIVVGVLLLVGVVGGVYGYARINDNPAQIAGVDGGIMSNLTGNSNGRNDSVFSDSKTGAGYTRKDGEDVAVDTGPTKEELHAKCDADGASWDDARSACLYPPGTGPLNPPSAICGDTYWNDSKLAQNDPNRLDSNPCKNGKCSLTDGMKSAGCTIQNVKCNGGGNVGVACNENIVYEGQNPAIIDDLKCGSQQIDIVCKSLCKTTRPVAFTSKITGVNCKTTTTNEPTPTPPSTPTMSCTGLTSTPATVPAPVIGTKLTFTCDGTVTPSTAGTLSYKFRYSINNGAFTAMTNKTATTSELTIAACGSYKVQCQACATLNSVITCDPIWTGATQ